MAETLTLLESERTPSPTWRLSLFGPFRLVDPLGIPVPFPTRKVEGLLAILIIHRQYGMVRDEIAEILWPGRPIDYQRANFRQALALLRKAIGQGSVETSRVHCRLRPDFHVVNDYDRPELRESSAFMPNQEGGWFEQIRIESEPAEETGGSRVSVVGSFLKTLSWFAVNDAHGMFQMLRSSAALARGIRYSDLLRLLDATRKDPAVAGWAAYWRGQSEDDLQLCAKLLRFAFSEAKKQNDAALASEVCLELGKVYSRTGQFDRAEQVCQVAEKVASDSGASTAISNATWLRGTILSHWSDRPNGLEFLERAEDMATNTIDRAIARSARAFYLVSKGNYDQGKEVLEWPMDIGANLGHQRIEIVTSMTQGLLSAHGGSRLLAIKDLENAVAICRSLKSTQFRVYGEELLAKLYLLDGDKSLAAGRLKSATQGRQEAHMHVTPLEAKRVEAVK